jgi:hypothetical protein
VRRAPSSPLHCPSIKLSKSPAEPRKPLREPRFLSSARHSPPFAGLRGILAAHFLAFGLRRRLRMRREGSMPLHSPFIARREDPFLRHSLPAAPPPREGMLHPEIFSSCALDESRHFLRGMPHSLLFVSHSPRGTRQNIEGAELEERCEPGGDPFHLLPPALDKPLLRGHHMYIDTSCLVPS